MVLNLWSSTTHFPLIVGINILALVGISAAPSAWYAATPTCSPTVWEPYGSLILSLSVVIRGQPDLGADGHRRRRAGADARHAVLHHHDRFRRLGRFRAAARRAQVLATQYVNSGGIKQYLMAIFPLAVIVLVFPSALPGNFSTGQAQLVALDLRRHVWRVHGDPDQSLFVYEHEDDDGDHTTKGSPLRTQRRGVAARLVVHLIAIIAVTQISTPIRWKAATKVECRRSSPGFWWRC